jgi:hypothetical protein
MFRSLVIYASLAASAVSALAPAPVPRGCGTHISVEQVAVAEQNFLRDMVLAENSAVEDRSDKKKTAEVTVHWHVIYENKTIEGGYTP